MEGTIIIDSRGMIEINNSTVKCYLGKESNVKSSEEIYNELKDEENKQNETYILGGEVYNIIYPISAKIISIITSEGKKLKSTIYFTDDIKNIIAGLKMKNPCFLEKNGYKAFLTDNDYNIFLFDKNMSEIKDVQKEEFSYKTLETNYNQYFKEFQNRESTKLEKINRNLDLYTKIENIKQEDYFITSARSLQFFKLNKFFDNKKRKGITDVIYGMFGNYASGKSFFLMYYNYKAEHPTTYLNLKALKNASQTKGFADLFNNELMILFFKLKKNYEDYKKFIEKISPYDGKELNTLIISIIKELKEEDAIIILDQYQEKIFENNNFIRQLKEILFEKESKIKIIISSSMNDSPIKEAYLNIITEKNNLEQENEKLINKTNDYIPYHFIEKLVEDEQIKKYITKIKKQDDEEFNSALRLFNYLPLYYNLCKQPKIDIKNFIEETKERIRKKIEKLNNNNLNLIYMDEIRKMIDNEITIDKLNFYRLYIPFKYFYVEKINKIMILRTHFPLVQEVWNDIIMKETIELFDGEIEYNGNVIGSFLELNIISNIKKKNISLEIDSFIKVDTINNFGELIEKDTENFTNKNIFVTQKNQNGPNFDIAYIKGKNMDTQKLVYIQVKKSYSNNRVDKEKMHKIFEEKKKNFENILGFIPKELNLVYISLINTKIKKAILEHDIAKRDKFIKVSSLGDDINSIVYSVNQLNNFCLQNGIQIYYYEPKTHKFFIKENNNFQEFQLDLFRKNENEINVVFSHSYVLDNLVVNSKECDAINANYGDFLKKKRKDKEKKFFYKINNVDFGIIFDFAKEYFNNVTIKNFIDLQKVHLDCKFQNLSNKTAIICLKKSDEYKNKFKVCSFIYNYHFIDVVNETLIEKQNKIFDRDNDVLVIIKFETITESLRIFLSQNN